MKTLKTVKSLKTETDADLALLEQMRWFRMAVNERICRASRDQDEKILVLLRQEPTAQLAEFYYLLWNRGIQTVGNIEKLAELHNAYIVQLTKDPQKMQRMGLTMPRLLDSMFTADTLPRLLQNWAEGPAAIDQSNLARFLAALMSPETCRKIAVACAAAGFLERSKSPYGTFLLRSTGILEGIYQETLREARGRIPT